MSAQQEAARAATARAAGVTGAQPTSPPLSDEDILSSVLARELLEDGVPPEDILSILRADTIGILGGSASTAPSGAAGGSTVAAPSNDSLARTCGALGEAPTVTLLKIVDNIQAHPGEPKYRILRKENARIAATVSAPGVVDVLRAAGFDEDAQSFALPHVDLPRLVRVRDMLAERALALEGAHVVRSAREQQRAAAGSSGASSTPMRRTDTPRRGVDPNLVKEIEADRRHRAALRGPVAPAVQATIEPEHSPSRPAPSAEGHNASTAPPRPFQLRVTLPVGGQLDLPPLPPTSSLRSLRVELEGRTGIVCAQQQILFGFPRRALRGRADALLSDLGVQSNDLLHLSDANEAFIARLTSGREPMQQVLESLPQRELPLMPMIDDGGDGDADAPSRREQLEQVLVLADAFTTSDFWGTVERQCRRGEVNRVRYLLQSVRALFSGLALDERLGLCERLTGVNLTRPAENDVFGDDGDGGADRPLLELSIVRENILHSAVDQLNRSPTHALRGARVVVNFANEAGVDGGGLRASFFSDFARHLHTEAPLLWRTTEAVAELGPNLPTHCPCCHSSF